MESSVINQIADNARSPAPLPTPSDLSSIDILNTDIAQIETNLWGADWPHKPLIKALKEQDSTQWHSLIKEMRYLSVIDANGNKALHAAVIAHNDEALRLLAPNYQIDNTKNKRGLTALHIAILQGNAERVQFLLEHGASAAETYLLHHPLFPPPIAVSGMILAILRGHEAVVRVIYHTLQQQQKLNDDQLVKCEPLGTVLHAAVISRIANTLDFLLTDVHMSEWAKSFLEVSNRSTHETPLAYAAKLGLSDSMEWLITAGAKPLAQNNLYSRTPLHYAVLSGSPLAVGTYLRLLGTGLHSGLTFTSQEPNPKGGRALAMTPLQLAQQKELKNDSGDTEEKDYPTIITTLENAQSAVAAGQGFLPPLHVEYKNLVLKGGGAKGLAYVGALEVLEDQNTLKTLTRIAGTSAGAITALLLALDFSVQEIEAALTYLTLTALLGEKGQISFEKIKNSAPALEQFLRALSRFIQEDSYLGKGKASLDAYHARDSVKQVWGLLKQLWNETGLSDGKALEGWLKGLVRGKLNVLLPAHFTYPGDTRANFLENLTFGRLKTLIQTIRHYSYQNEEGKTLTKPVHLRELFVFATDAKEEKVHVLNTEDARWKNVNVIEAVCASAALPGVFKPRVIQNVPREGDPSQFEALTLVDGGVLRNYPIEHFDALHFQVPYLDKRIEYRQRTNQETLGLSLVQANQVPAQGLSQAITELTSAISHAVAGNTNDDIGVMKLVWNISQVVYQAEAILQEMRGDIKERSIDIDVTGFETTEFDLMEENNSNRLAEIIDRGRMAVIQKLRVEYPRSVKSVNEKNKQKEAPRLEKKSGENFVPKN